MVRRSFAGMLVLFWVSACRPATTQGGTPAPPSGSLPGQSPTAPSTLESVPTVLQPGPCQHLLWPLTSGATWSYQLTRPDASPQTVNLSATVADASADLTLDINGVPALNTFQCAPDGFYGALGALVGHPDLGGGLVLTNPDGPFLPSADRLLPLGTPASWDAQYGVTGVLTLPLPGGAVQASVTGGDSGQSSVVLYASAQSLETVSTPAGTFTALPVEQSALFNLQVTTGEGLAGVVFGDTRSRLYWVEGVGLVRLDFEGGMLSSTLGGAPVNLPPGVRLELVQYALGQA